MNECSAYPTPSAFIEAWRQLDVAGRGGNASWLVVTSDPDLNSLTALCVGVTGDGLVILPRAYSRLRLFSLVALFGSLFSHIASVCHTFLKVVPDRLVRFRVCDLPQDCQGRVTDTPCRPGPHTFSLPRQ